MLPNEIHYEIFNYLDDYSLVEICQSSQHYYNICKNSQYYNRIVNYLEKRKELQKNCHELEQK